MTSRDTYVGAYGFNDSEAAKLFVQKLSDRECGFASTRVRAIGQVTMIDCNAPIKSDGLQKVTHLCLGTIEMSEIEPDEKADVICPLGIPNDILVELFEQAG